MLEMSNINAVLKSRPKNLKKNEVEAWVARIASAPNNSNLKKYSANLNRLLKAITVNEALAKWHRGGPAWKLNKMRNFLNGVNEPKYLDLPFLIKMSNSYNKSGNTILSNAANALISNVPLQNRNIKPYTGKILFHGSKSVIRHGYPNNPKGNWFAESVHQAILHALGRYNAPNTKRYLYVYHVRTPPPRLIEVKTAADFANLGINITRTLRENGNWAFTNANYNVASGICDLVKEVDGWRFVADQTQVMLCRPKKFLKLHKAYEIMGRAPAGGAPSFRVNMRGGGSARWHRHRGTVYALRQIWPKLPVNTRRQAG